MPDALTQDALLAVRPEVSRAVARIMSGAHFTCLLLDDKRQRATALEAVLDQVTEPTTRVVWVGNPLRSPLTIERFLIQIAGPEVDLRIDRSPAQLVKLMTQPLGDESRLLVVVQQPETMGAEARDILAAIPAHLSGAALQMQFLFVGTTAFTLMRFVEPGALVTTTQPAPIVVSRKPLLARLYVLLPLALLVGAALGVGGTFAVSNLRARLTDTLGMATPQAAEPPAPTPTAQDVTPPSPIPTPSPAPAAAAAQAPAPASAPEPKLAELRREFDAFLATRTSLTPPMTEAQKDALFHEFMAQHRRN